MYIGLQFPLLHTAMSSIDSFTFSLMICSGPWYILDSSNLPVYYLQKTSPSLCSVCVCVSCSVISESLRFYGLQPSGSSSHQDPLPMEFLGKNTGVGSHSLLQRVFLTQGSNPRLLHCRQILYHLSHQSVLVLNIMVIQLLSSVQLLQPPWAVAHQASLFMGFFRQEYWSGLPFPSPGESSRPRDQTHIFPALQADSLPTELQGKPP